MADQSLGIIPPDYRWLRSSRKPRSLSRRPAIPGGTWQCVGRCCPTPGSHRSCRIHSEGCASFADHDQPAARGCIRSAFAPAHGDRLIGHDSRLMLIRNRLVLIHHPRHCLRIGVDIGGRDVAIDADVRPERAHIGTGCVFEFPSGHLSRIADHPAFASAQGNVDHG